MSAIEAMGSSCKSLLSLLNDLHFDKTIKKRIIMKAMSISIRSSYYIFCRRSKPWSNPELLAIKFFHSSYLLNVIDFFSFFLLNMFPTRKTIYTAMYLVRCIIVICYI